jgi:hypothetical protein
MLLPPDRMEKCGWAVCFAGILIGQLRYNKDQHASDRQN